MREKKTTPNFADPKLRIMAMTAIVLMTPVFFFFPRVGSAGDEPKRKKIDLPNFPEGAAYILGRLSNEELLDIERGEPVYRAILIREGLDASMRREAIAELAAIRKTDALTEILDGIARIDQSDANLKGALNDLIQFLMGTPAAELKKKWASLAKFATDAGKVLAREAGYAALILADGAVEAAWRLAEESENGVVDLLNAVAMIPDPNARAALYPKVNPLLHNASNREIRQSAILAIASIPSHEKETFATLASFVMEDAERDAAIEAIRQIPSAHWPKNRIPDLAADVVDYATGVAPEKRNTPEFKRALQLGNELANLLPTPRGREVREALGALGIRTVTVRAIAHLLLYDKIHIVVQAGEPIEITFENPGIMPHNLVIVVPGALEEIGLAADRMIVDPAGGSGKKFVPNSQKVLVATPLINPRGSATLAFVAPNAIGNYPYLCTFPGHWVRMNGVMHVVEDVNAWIAENPDKTGASQLAARGFVRAWKLEELVNELDQLESGRSLDRGRELFTAASCVSCHQVRKVGGLIGPDLAEVAERLKPAEMLAEIIEPSKTINEKYRTWLIVMKDGAVTSGIVTREDAKSIHIVENPLADSEGTEIARDRIEAMKASILSTMPVGLLNALTLEEILDLLAYIRSDSDSSS